MRTTSQRKGNNLLHPSAQIVQRKSCQHSNLIPPVQNRNSSHSKSTVFAVPPPHPRSTYPNPPSKLAPLLLPAVQVQSSTTFESAKSTTKEPSSSPPVIAASALSNNASNLIFPVLVLPVYEFAKSVTAPWRWGSGLTRMEEGYFRFP